MTFQPHGHQQPPFYAANGTVYENMHPLNAVASPGGVCSEQPFSPQLAYQSQEYEYAIMTQSSLPHPHTSPYALGPRQMSTTPADLSPGDQVQIEFTDLSAPYPEDLNYKPRKQDGSRQPSTSMHMRRRAQNRASQRAFRERKEKHTQDLQRKLTEVEQQYEQLKQNYDVVHKEKCQLEEANRRCSCGGSIVASPGSVGDSQASDFGDLVEQARMRHSGAVSVDLEEVDDPVYEVVDWGSSAIQ